MTLLRDALAGVSGSVIRYHSLRVATGGSGQPPLVLAISRTATMDTDRAGKNRDVDSLEEVIGG
jgi:hypothetical protein